MRFYLDSRDQAEATRVMPWMHVAGIAAFGHTMTSSDSPELASLIRTAVEIGRRDWKVFVSLADPTPTVALSQAECSGQLVADITGGRFAGPTVVFTIPAQAERLATAAALLKGGEEVCLVGIRTSLQTLASATLPPVLVTRNGIEMEGPPGSRNPWHPNYLCWEFDPSTKRPDSNLDKLVETASTLALYKVRTRVLVSGIPDKGTLDQLLQRMSAATRAVPVDVTLPFEILGAVHSDGKAETE